MIDYTTTVQRTGQPLTWEIALRDGTVLTVSREQLDELASALAFRLDPFRVQAGPTGVHLEVHGGGKVHLCHSDEAEDFAKAVEAAAGRNGVTV